MIKSVMMRAWEIAKAAVGTFGGKVKEYFAVALKMAWAEVKAPKKAGLNLSSGVSKISDAVIETEAHSGWSKGWMALVTLAAKGAKFDLDRTFIRADISNVNSAGNGMLTYKVVRQWAHCHRPGADVQIPAAESFVRLI